VSTTISRRRRSSGAAQAIRHESPAPPLLELCGITKRFSGTIANERIDFDLVPGEVHALLGENGAGKSTLMNVLFGLYTPDEGEIRVHGQPLAFSSPRDALEHGIGMVHQHFMLIPVMTVAENIVLAREPHRAGLLLDLDAAEARVAELSRRFGLEVDGHARTRDVELCQGWPRHPRLAGSDCGVTARCPLPFR
jgi:general nucleoside transport system ATP-binding protein